MYAVIKRFEYTHIKHKQTEVHTKVISRNQVCVSQRLVLGLGLLCQNNFGHNRHFKASSVMLA